MFTIIQLWKIWFFAKIERNYVSGPKCNELRLLSKLKIKNQLWLLIEWQWICQNKKTLWQCRATFRSHPAAPFANSPEDALSCDTYVLTLSSEFSRSKYLFLLEFSTWTFQKGELISTYTFPCTSSKSQWNEYCTKFTEFYSNKTWVMNHFLPQEMHAYFLQVFVYDLFHSLLMYLYAQFVVVVVVVIVVVKTTSSLTLTLTML